MPFFSIITINLNNATGLKKTIESIVQQTFSDYEFIIIDGGSADESVMVIKGYENIITHWSTEKDKGIYDAQNKGISKANGKYCLFLNSGDYLANENILQKVIDTNPKANILYGDILLSKSGTIMREKKYPSKLSHYFLLTDNLAHQSQFIQLSLFEKFGLYDETYQIVADYEFFMRMYYVHKCSCLHVPTIITVYNLDGISANENQVEAINRERYHIQKLYMPLFLVIIYRAYALVLQSKIYHWPLIARALHFFRNIVFKIIKPKNEIK